MCSVLSASKPESLDDLELSADRLCIGQLKRRSLARIPENEDGPAQSNPHHTCFPAECSCLVQLMWLYHSRQTKVSMSY